jgi:kinesin family protein 13
VLVLTEKYTRGVSAVESILTLDRLRQSVAVKELLQARGQPLIRKTVSVPNIAHMLNIAGGSSGGLGGGSGLGGGMGEFQVSRSESVSELCNSGSNNTSSTSSSSSAAIGGSAGGGLVGGAGGVSGSGCDDQSAKQQFGIGEYSQLCSMLV